MTGSSPDDEYERTGSTGSAALRRVFERSRAGDPQATEALIPLLYDELRLLARHLFRDQGPAHTLQPTALVHEAWMRLGQAEERDYKSRGHFFATAAQAMRQILVDQARRKASLKRGGDRKALPLEDADVSIESTQEDVLAVDEALTRLEHESSRQAKVVSLRYFAGLTFEEIAQSLETSLATVERDWRFAKAWLHRELAGGDREA